MPDIAIIGGGFTGTMAAVNLFQRAGTPFDLTLFHERGPLNKGLAYQPYSSRHLLNVIAARMSAFTGMPDHFLDWLLARPQFAGRDRALIGQAFLPRALYGEYLAEIWKDALVRAAKAGIKVNVIHDRVMDLDREGSKVRITTSDHGSTIVDRCVIATGNQLPRDPARCEPSFLSDPRYHRDPWKIDAVTGLADDLPVLIIGNGLTMVDTVLGLLEQGFKGEIHSISPNGFNILPHRHTGFKYNGLAAELPQRIRLRDLVKLVNKHVKLVREYGLSAEPVIDSLRPHTQRIWRGMDREEKELFMRRLRHLWGVARHRIPLHTYDKIQRLRIDGRLKVSSGTITNITANSDHVSVEYLDRATGEPKQLHVQRVINCTGPETDIMRMEGSFLKNALVKGLLVQDDLRLGIRTDGTFHVIDREGRPHPNIFTLGSNLKGELWESTAVNELREQAERLAEGLCMDLSLAGKGMPAR